MKIKKLKLNSIFKTGIVFLGISLLLWNCQEEEILLNQEEQKLEFSTVSKLSAKGIFESYSTNQEKSYRKENSVLEVTPNWDSFKQEDLNFTNSLLSSVNIETNALTTLTSRLVFLNLGDRTLRVIESKKIIELDGNKIKEGYTYYHNLDGKFILGLKVENSLVTKKLVKSRTVNKASFLSMLSLFMQDCNEDLDLNSEFCNNELDEVVVNGTSGNATTEASVYWIIYGGSGGYSDSDGYGDSWDTGGGGGGNGSDGDNDQDNTCSGGKVYNYINGNCECPEDQVEDANGNCVEKPCTGDPVANPEIAPQTNSGIQGGMHDTCARRNSAYSCNGVRGRKWHNGVDLKKPQGAPIYAVYDGTATIHTQRDDKGNLDGAGYYTAIVSNVNGKTVRMVYFHLQEDNRITGQVKAGDIIRHQGDSGNLKNGIKQGYAISHVHIKTQENGVNVNPLLHLKTTIDPSSGQTTNPCNN